MVGLRTDFSEGTKFGRWTVISYTETRGNARYWLCRCECGRQRNVRGALLRAGKTLSCGCLQREVRKIHRKFAADPQETSRREYLRSYKNNCTQRKREWFLSSEEFYKLVFSSCFYCGENPATKYSPYMTKFGKVRSTRSSIKEDYANQTAILVNGIDRVDNSKGYISSNCVPCCKVCNIAKRDLSQDKFIVWGKRLGKFLEEKF